MKTIFLTAVAMMVSSAAIFAQVSTVSLLNNLTVLKQEDRDIKKKEEKQKRLLRKEENGQVGYRTLQHFNDNFQGAEIINTQRLPGYDKIHFKQDGIFQDAFYDQNSELIGTVTVKTFEDIPLKAQEYINTHYSDYSKQAVILYDDNEDNDTGLQIYEYPFGNADNYFVELQKGADKIALQVGFNGEVSYFSTVR